jgi:hypothetical protein
MLELLRTQNSSTLFLIPKVNYTHIYNQLKAELPERLLCLFAKPQKGSSNTLWLTAFNQTKAFQSFTSLDQSQQEEIANQIEDKKGEIIQLLTNHATLGPYLEQLFQITSQDDIKVIEANDGATAVLCSWGCKLAAQRIESNPLTTALAKASNNRSLVNIHLKYNDGDIGSNLAFSLRYKGQSKAYQTDEYGQSHLGKFKHGSPISILFEIGGESRYQHDFVVDTRNDYHVQIPKLGDLLLNVVNQKLEPLAKAEVEVIYKSETLYELTNEEGLVSLHYLEQGETIQVSARYQTDLGLIQQSESFLIQAEDNQYTLILKEREAANLRIRTVDQKGNYFSTPIRIDAEDGSRSLQTDESGELYLKHQYGIGDQLTIEATDFENSLYEYRIEEKDNELLLKLTIPEPEIVSFKLIDHKNRPLPGIEIDFVASELQERKETNSEASCIFSKENFVDGEKISCKIYIPKKTRKGKTKTKVYKKSVKYDEQQSEYILKLKKRNWWWLLLLLIPLLLLQCEKTIPVKVMNGDDNISMSNASVSLQYHQQNLFRPWALFAVDSIKRDSLTNLDGEVHYQKVRYSLYSLLFYNFTGAQVTASCDCYTSDTAQHYFHYMPDTVQLELVLKTHDFDFLVIDSVTRRPVPDAQVIIRAKYKDRMIADTLMSDSLGMVYSKGIPACATDVFIGGVHKDFGSDELFYDKGSDLIGDLKKKRLLELHKRRPYCPDREIVFQVCNSNRAKDDDFQVYLNDIPIGYLNLGFDDQVGSVFIASKNRNLKVKEPDFVCPLSKMKVYYFDPDIVKYGTNVIVLKNIKRNNNGNKGTISIRNYKVSGEELIAPCRIADLNYQGKDGKSFSTNFYLTECCEKE